MASHMVNQISTASARENSFNQKFVQNKVAQEANHLRFRRGCGAGGTALVTRTAPGLSDRVHARNQSIQVA